MSKKELVIIGLIVFGLGLLAQDRVEQEKCEALSESTGLETRHDFFDECYVKTGHGWIMLDRYLVERHGQRTR